LADLVPFFQCSLTPFAAVAADLTDPHVSTGALAHSGQQHCVAGSRFVHFLGAYQTVHSDIK
jgi:hypothetical protein